MVIDGRCASGPRTLWHVTVVGDTTLGAEACFSGVRGHEPQDLVPRHTERRAHRDAALRGMAHRGTSPTRTRGGLRRVHVERTWPTTAGWEPRHPGDGVVLAGMRTGQRAFISGNCVVHQFVRIGRLVIMRGLSRTSRDVPPFTLMDDTHVVRGINRVGMRRAGMDATRIRAVATAFRMLFRVRLNLRDAMARVEHELGAVPEVAEVLAFIRASKRGVAMGPRAGRGPDDVDTGASEA
jgi:UDP-N-acetylglucosamine acyltransferase